MALLSALRAAHARVAGLLGLATRRDLEKITNRVEAWMELTEDEVNERLAARIAAVNAELASVRESDRQKTEALATTKADLETLRTQLSEQQAGELDRTQRAVAEALTLDTAKDIDRLRGHLKALGDDLDADIPEVPVPPVGAPAEIPDTPSGVVVPPVDESSLPSTDQQSGEVTDVIGGTEPGADIPPLEGETGQAPAEQAQDGEQPAGDGTATS